MQNTNVPNGWIKTTLGKVGEVSMCKRIMKHQTNDVGGVPFFKIGTFGGIADAYIDKDLFCEYKKKYSYPNIGDILLSAAGTIGRLVVFDGNDAYFQDSNIVWVSNNEKLVINKYLYYLYRIIKWRTSEGGIVSRLYNNEIRKTEIIIPPLAEQKKIAEILGTWDRAIEELTGLIAEKKELKRGLMQRLLTGIQRLPGFTKPWKKIKLSDVLEECTETTTINNQYDILTSSRRGIFKQEDYFDKQVASQDNIGYKIIHNGDFTYRAMTDDDKFCFNQLTDLEIGIVSPAYAVFQTKKIPGNILKFILNSGRFGYELLKEAQGGTRKSLKYNSLIKLQIYVPDDEKEMDKLSDCLFVADSEIDLLNQQLDVLREQKRGLMQKLLTGEIRVKVDNE